MGAVAPDDPEGTAPRPSWLPLAGAAGVLLLGLVVVLLMQLRSGGDEVGTFTVPSYAWDGDGNEALVSGTLWVTQDGCTLVESGARTYPVVFPDAVGVAYVNGARAVVDGQGRVYAVSGQSFEYAGGFAPPGSTVARAWQEQCGDPGEETAYVNDRAAGERQRSAPATPTREGPTAPGP